MKRNIPSISALQSMSAAELRAVLTGDPVEAAAWVRVGATHGLAAAQLRLGQMLLDGIGMPRDEVAALGWFKTAALNHDAEAMNMVGRCYENGWGVIANAALAVEWYKKSAKAGDAWGQYNLGHMFFDGMGIDIDRYQALALYLKSARQGHGRAMNLVARCYEEGWGTAQDLTMAADWYRKSSETGYFRAQYNYATILANKGQIDSAAEWFWKAAVSGTNDIRVKINNDLTSSRHPEFHRVARRVMELLHEPTEAGSPLPEPSECY